MTKDSDTLARKGKGRREELISAAIRVMAREGVASTTTRKISSESGLPLGLVHYWFANKEKLFEGVLAATLQRLETAIEEARSLSPGVAYPLSELWATWRSVAQDDPAAQLAIYELTCTALRTPGLRVFAERQYTLYRNLARHLVLRWQGITEATDQTDTQAFETLLVASFDGLLLAWLADPQGTDVDGALRLLSRFGEQHL